MRLALARALFVKVSGWREDFPDFVDPFRSLPSSFSMNLPIIVRSLLIHKRAHANLVLQLI